MPNKHTSHVRKGYEKEELSVVKISLSLSLPFFRSNLQLDFGSRIGYGVYGASRETPKSSQSSFYSTNACTNRDTLATCVNLLTN